VPLQSIADAVGYTRQWCRAITAGAHKSDHDFLDKIGAPR